MSQDLHKLTVSIEAQLNKFRKACDDVKKEAASAASSADKSFNSINGGNSDKGVKKLLANIKKMNEAVKSFKNSAKLDAGLVGPTQKYTELANQLQAAYAEADRLQGELDAMGDSAIGTEGYTYFAEKLANTKVEAALLERELERLSYSASFENLQPPSFIADLKAYVAEAKAMLAGFAHETRMIFEEMAPPGLVKFADRIHSIGSGIRDTGRHIKDFATGVKNDMARAGRGLLNFLQKIPLLRSMGRHANSASSGFRTLRRRIISMAMAAATAVVGFNAIRNGMANLEGYSAQTRSDLSMLRNALATCQNALATAFAPILTVVAPLLTTLINMITTAATAVAHFIAALTGHATVVVAKSVGSGVAGSMGGAADATNAANDAAQEYQRTLMGFDQINKLDDPTSGGSGGSGGGGGGGGVGGGTGGMFETVEINGAALEWAERFKEAWKNADFTEIGGIIGQKLKDALDSIPWDEIQAVAEKIGKSVATFLNGFFETPGLFTTIGDTIAEALNTLVITVHSFTVNFHWTSLGQAISDSINGFFSTFDFKLAAETISNIAKGILDSATAAISGINWANIGKTVVGFIADIDWIGIFKSAVGLANSLVTAAHDLLKGAFQEAVVRLKEWISSGQMLSDIKTWGSASIDLSANLVGSAWDLVKSLVGGTFEIVASLVGLPKNIVVSATAKISEFTDGIKTKVLNFKAKMNEWQDSLGGKVISFKAKMNSWQDSLGGKVISFKAKITSFTNAIKSKTLSFKAKVTGFIGKGAAKIKKLLGLAEGGIYKGGQWRPITTAATGGAFGEGQMFIAREAGPELVGTIGASTAVMNNDQIVASVSNGVAKAVAAVMGSGQSNSTPVILQGDAAKFFRVIQTAATEYTRATGKPAFPV